MSIRFKAVLHCDLEGCGHEWLQRPAFDRNNLPRLCAKCKRTGWNTGKDYTQDAPTESPAPRHAPEPVPVAQSLAELKTKFNLRSLSELQPQPQRTLDTSDTQEDRPLNPADRGYLALFRRQHGRNPKDQDELNSFKAQRLAVDGK